MRAKTAAVFKRLTAFFAAAVMTVSLMGCGAPKGETKTESDSTSDATATESRDPYTDVSGKKIGIAMPTKSLERWNRDGAYLEEHFQAEGCETTLVYSDNDAEQQEADVRALIEEGCDLLVISAIADTSLSGVLAEAKAKSIPVIAYDRLIRDTDAISYYVSYDNYKVGQLQGRYIIESLGLKLEDTSKEHHIEFTAGDPGDNNAGYFFNGAFDTLKPYLDAGVVSVPSGQTAFTRCATELWDSGKAQSRMKEILNRFYTNGTQLDAVVCSNDSTAIGVTKAIESDYSGKNTVIVTGQDGDAANLNNIKAGKQSMTVYKPLEHEAIATLDLGLTLLNGDVADANLISDSKWEFECVYDTSSYDNGKGIVKAYLLAPVVVTADNLSIVE